MAADVHKQMEQLYLALNFILFYTTVIFCAVFSSDLSITPDFVRATEGEQIQVNCTVASPPDVFSLRWEMLGRSPDVRKFKQFRYHKETQTLLIPEARFEDSGVYQCVLTDAQGEISFSKLLVYVEKSAEPVHCEKFFRCSDTIQISCRYRCDGVRNCQSGADEENCHRNVAPQQLPYYRISKKTGVDSPSDTLADEPASKGTAAANTKANHCTGSFFCNSFIRIGCQHKCDGHLDCPGGEDERDCPASSGSFADEPVGKDIAAASEKPNQCTGYFFCDSLIRIGCQHKCDGQLDCPGGEDEKDCLVTQKPSQTDNNSDEDQMVWLKTTVYTVIACTVGIVLLISVVVIAIFRVKMKRAAVRRAIREAARRRRRGNRCEAQGSRSQRTEPVDQEPFISAPSPTHFGNIIVNVNNSVQYVPNRDLHVGVLSPPSYTEVLAETGRLDRHSPPPEYSTIDRNPNRVSSCPASPMSEMQVQPVCEVRSERNIASTESSTETAQSRSNVDIIQHSQSVQDNNTSTESTSCTETAGSDSVVNRDSTNSLGRRPHSGRSNRASRNIRSVASPRRPKQLIVRDGQIVLDDSSSSSSPETMNRNTQTNPADISTANQNPAKPAHLLVQGGQIVLAGQVGDHTSDTEAAGAQGQLDVKDGHIVFKPTGS